MPNSSQGRTSSLAPWINPVPPSSPCKTTFSSRMSEKVMCSILHDKIEYSLKKEKHKVGDRLCTNWGNFLKSEILTGYVLPENTLALSTLGEAAGTKSKSKIKSVYGNYNNAVMIKIEVLKIFIKYKVQVPNNLSRHAKHYSPDTLCVCNSPIHWPSCSQRLLGDQLPHQDSHVKPMKRKMIRQRSCAPAPNNSTSTSIILNKFTHTQPITTTPPI